MVKQYEQNIILPRPEFRDQNELEKPIPEKKTIVTKVDKTLKSYTQSFER